MMVQPTQYFAVIMRNRKRGRRCFGGLGCGVS
jgi:hypothetical protein